MNFFDKIKKALKKTSDKISVAIAGRKADADFINDIEEALILADVGIETTKQIVTELGKQKFSQNDSDDDIKNFLVHQIETIMTPYEIHDFTIAHNPEVILVIGVNGNGKTTTIAKLAHLLQNEGHNPLLVAGDTFRAAAVAQLEYWAQKISAPILKGADKSDAASLAYKAIEHARTNQNDIIIIDTAGRLQNRSDLMDELKKIKRVISKLDDTAPHRTILVLDGLSGQAVHSQVDIFNSEIGVDNLIVTKLDATAKGGTLIALSQKYKLPILAIGIGEGIDDLRPFNAHEYAKALIS